METGSVSNPKFERLWSTTGLTPHIARSVKEDGSRALKGSFDGSFRIMFLPDDTSPNGFIARLIDRPGPGDMIKSDGTIIFPAPLGVKDCRELYMAIESWLNAYEIIFGFDQYIRYAPLINPQSESLNQQPEVESFTPGLVENNNTWESPRDE